MQMSKIGLLGSTQIEHIERLFFNNGISVVNIGEKISNKCRIKNIISFIVLLFKIDTLYVVGQFGCLRHIRIAKFFGKKIIVHWIGTDVLNAMNNTEEYSFYRCASIINLSGSSNLQKELLSIGIHASVIPIIPSGKLEYSLGQSTENHAVLVYMPEGREIFYGYEFVRELVLKHKKCEFHIVANSNTSLLPYKNVIFYGRISPVEMAELYNRISILLRLPEHDGLSLMLLEALGRGKQVIYTYEFPYCETPISRSIEDVMFCFDKVLATPPFINKEAHNYVTQMYNSETIFDLYKKILIDGK